MSAVVMRGDFGSRCNRAKSRCFVLKLKVSLSNSVADVSRLIDRILVTNDLIQPLIHGGSTIWRRQIFFLQKSGCLESVDDCEKFLRVASKVSFSEARNYK